jgi:ABC-2 type transport system permease protein
MRLVGSELLKIWTAPRTLIGIVLAELAIVGFATASVIDSWQSESDFGPRSDLERSLFGDAMGVSLAFAVVLGILVITWEYRHGTITQTFLTTPARERVLAAKAIVAAAIGSALVLPALLLMLIIAELWAGEDFHFGGQEWRFVAQLALATAAVAVLGFEVGACTRRQLGAVIVFFVWFAFVEPAAEHLWSSGREYLPLHAVGGLLGTTGSTFPSFGKAAVETAVYLAVLGAAAVAITRRRDIT